MKKTAQERRESKNHTLLLKVFLINPLRSEGSVYWIRRLSQHLKATLIFKVTEYISRIDFLRNSENIWTEPEPLLYTESRVSSFEFPKHTNGWTALKSANGLKWSKQHMRKRNAKKKWETKTRQENNFQRWNIFSSLRVSLSFILVMIWC